MNILAENSANHIKTQIQNVSDGRKEAIKFIDQLINDNTPELQPHFASNVLGYGSFKYLDSKKKPQEWPVVALANQKNYISLYVCALDDGEYLAEKYQDELGKVSIGRSCIRFKKIDDINVDGFKKILKLAAKSPGLVGTETIQLFVLFLNIRDASGTAIINISRLQATAFQP